MKTVFADTGYWIALLDPQDTLHQRAVNLSVSLAQAQICTSEMVLTEVLNHFSKRGTFLRQTVVAFIQTVQQSPAIEILPQTSELFSTALTLYSQRPDQAWSLTDCASFCLMQQQKIQEALAYDRHFEQAGLIALLR
ncbi:type II toxin-antitoxin system VapC family toxin [Pantanalinema rosaneae CENA516]|uniref:type II toxin-antitoxin system VapC family toxin n=1 Tax=Pantanalinema rosaneae TaxID=1620701 RepID=UPI003D6FBD38